MKETLGFLCVFITVRLRENLALQRQFTRLLFLFLDSSAVLCVAYERVGFSSTVSPWQHTL